MTVAQYRSTENENPAKGSFSGVSLPSPAGGGAGSGGAGGGANSPSDAARAAAAARATTVLRAFQVTLAASKTPQPLPAVYVPDGYQVRLRANNGTVAGNTSMVYYAENYDAFASGHGIPINQFDDLQVQVNNTGRLWLYGATVGDGVVVSIVKVVSGV